MSIANDGTFGPCRWANDNNNFFDKLPNIREVSPVEWFQVHMERFRKVVADGQGHTTGICSKCYKMEEHGKISGRQKQLLKTGIINDNNFEKTVLSSPWFNEFYNSSENIKTNLLPQDWQIDLGNQCNSGCVMCSPRSSSFLESEFKKIGILNQKQKKSWSSDPVAVENFFDCIDKSPNIKYMHFIGGEPLIVPTFKSILIKMIENKLNETVTLGFTTNLTVWNEKLFEIFKKFENLNVGLSVECLDPLNDYVRYGSNIETVKKLLDKWKNLSDEYGWNIQLRITPTILTIEKLDTIYEYAWENNIPVESCNFLQDPDFLRPSVLPKEYREFSIEKLKNWVTNHSSDYKNNLEQNINIRHPNLVKQTLLEDAKSYINYLEKSKDESYLLSNLIHYLNNLEKSRKNCILDYLPHYESLFKTFGYKKIH